ncbi:MAG: hypothetical protein AAFQ37_05295 [Bacteroidota bacterium]
MCTSTTGATVVVKVADAFSTYLVSNRSISNGWPRKTNGLSGNRCGISGSNGLVVGFKDDLKAWSLIGFYPKILAPANRTSDIVLPIQATFW